MIANEFFNTVRDALSIDSTVYDLYSTLAALIERNPTLALEHGFFEFLVRNGLRIVQDQYFCFYCRAQR